MSVPLSDAEIPDSIVQNSGAEGMFNISVFVFCCELMLYIECRIKYELHLTKSTYFQLKVQMYVVIYRDCSSL